MADLTALKQSIAAAIRANGEGAITGPVLQEQLLDMVDAMEVDTFGGFLDSETVPPSDTTKPHIFIGYGEFTNDAFDITVAEGEVWVVCRMADEQEWTKENITSNLLNRVQALEEGTQKALTPGDGIDIDAEGNISVKTGNGLKADDEGNIEVETTDEPQTNPALPVNGKGVTDYIDNEKGSTIAELDANGKVKAEQLPDDVAYFEEGVDPTDPEYQDEYERILAKMYQNLEDWDVMSQAARQATQMANQAAENAEAKGNKAKSQGDSAEYFAQRAESMANAAEASKNNADASAAKAERAVENVSTAIAAANQSTARANTAADTASTAATEAQSAKEAANAAAGAATAAAGEATTAAGNADTKAAYAEQQGDYAKSEIDGAKGGYESLADRFQHVDETAMYFEETGLSSDPDMEDEYRRVLRKAYQMLTDMQEATEDTEAKAALAAAAAELCNARSVECAEKTALAGQAAAYATSQGNYAKQKADEIDLARGQYQTLSDRLDAMQRQLEAALYFQAVNN